jgi:hypothetical protein
MPKLGFSKAQSAEMDAPPAGFANTLSFRRQREQADPVRHWTFIGLGIVLLVFLGSMIAVLLMHAPSL